MLRALCVCDAALLSAAGDNWSAVSNTAILYMGAVPAPPEDGLSAGAVTGIVVGVLAVLVAVIMAGVFVNSRRRARLEAR